ncbi:MAG: GNAT family N-acetyltransferase [Ruminococcus sp.]|nr:GNAT family N-acetyltransferase [Ruminococcus sp.]
MLSLKKANFDDIDEEFRFISSVPYDENGFINEWAGIKREDFREKCLAVMADNEKGSGLPEGYVPETSYFLWNDEQIIGWYRIRHYLCESLVNGSGHIGQYISPHFRGKGYGTKGLSLALRKAVKIIPENEVYLRAHRDNLPSIRTMLGNDGYIHHEDDTNVYVRIPCESIKQSILSLPEN